MAKINYVFLISMFLIIMASLSSISHGLFLFGIPIGEFSIRGVVRCSLNGDPNAPPVSGSIVNFVCANETTNIAQAVTDPTGVFTIVLKITDTFLYDPSYCVVEANLPAGTCTISPPDGILTATINLVNLRITGVLNAANYTTGPFLDSTL